MANITLSVVERDTDHRVPGSRHGQIRDGLCDGTLRPGSAHQLRRLSQYYLFGQAGEHLPHVRHSKPHVHALIRLLILIAAIFNSEGLAILSLGPHGVHFRDQCRVHHRHTSTMRAQGQAMEPGDPRQVLVTQRSNRNCLFQCWQVLTALFDSLTHQNNHTSQLLQVRPTLSLHCCLRISSGTFRSARRQNWAYVPLWVLASCKIPVHIWSYLITHHK